VDIFPVFWQAPHIMIFRIILRWGKKRLESSKTKGCEIAEVQFWRCIAVLQLFKECNPAINSVVCNIAVRESAVLDSFRCIRKKKSSSHAPSNVNPFPLPIICRAFSTRGGWGEQKWIWINLVLIFKMKKPCPENVI
jgi:hypothetical protein